MNDKELNELAEKRYPYFKSFAQSQSDNVRILLRRQDFIAGYKAALQSIPKEDNEALENEAWLEVVRAVLYQVVLT